MVNTIDITKVLTAIYTDIKNKVITSIDKQMYYIMLSKHYSKKRIDDYIEKIQNDEVSLDDFLKALSFIR